jgi:hypothetical protein
MAARGMKKPRFGPRHSIFSPTREDKKSRLPRGAIWSPAVVLLAKLLEMNRLKFNREIANPWDKQLQEL